MAHPEEALHWGSEVFPSESDFQMMVLSYLSNNMGVKLAKDTNLMDTLWFKTDPLSKNHLLHPGLFSLK